MAKTSTAEVIVESLIAHGVDMVFGIPGVHTYDLIDAIARRRDALRFINTRHEQGAAYMAYGYARSTGKTGVYTVVPGPGMLNSSAALATALGANTPVLCLTGNIMSHLMGKGRGQLHELPDQLATMASITKWSARIDQPTDAGDVMSEAFWQMHSGRPGPVAIEVPWDVFGQVGDVSPLPAAKPITRPSIDANTIAEAAELLSEAKNPMVIVGAGAMDARAEVEQLAELLRAPVTCHRSGKGVISDASPHSLSMAAAYELWPEVDVVVGIGTRLELVYFRWQVEPDGLNTIRIDIDHEEFDRIPTTVGIHADAAEGTRALNTALAERVAPRSSRAEEFNAVASEARSAYEVVQPQVGYLDVIRDVLPDDGFFVEEISQVGFTARFAFPVFEPRTYVTGGYQENLGFGFATALGVKAAHPERAVVSINGDGGFLFAMAELATAAQHDLGVVAIVFDNRAFGNVLRDQTTKFDGRLLGSELHNPDFAQLGKVFGVHAAEVHSPEALGTELALALERNEPALISVILEDVETSPWPFIRPNAKR